MRVIVHSEDLSGRDDTGLYSKSSIDEALDCFYVGSDLYYSTADSDEGEDDRISREDAKAAFEAQGEVVFYASDGARTRIVRDISDTQG